MSIILECKNIKKKVGTFLLNNVNFRLEEGMILGVIGVNGSGKTTLLNCILRAYGLNGPMDGGEILLGGLSPERDRKAYLDQLGFVSSQNIYDILLSPQAIGRLYGEYYSRFSMEEYLGLLEEFKVCDAGAKKEPLLKELSTGEVIKAQLAFAISCHPKLLVLDEPVGNLDVEFRDYFYSKLREIAAGGETTIIISSHIAEELEHFADYILWLEKGKKSQLYYGTMDELLEQYRILPLDRAETAGFPKKMVVGRKERETHQEVMVRMKDEYLKYLEPFRGKERFPDLTEIMYYETKAKESENDEGYANQKV